MEEIEKASLDAQLAVLKAFTKSAQGGSVEGPLKLAEAYAWIIRPDQSHGSVNISVSK